MTFRIYKDGTFITGEQPPSQGSRSLNPLEIARLSGFPLGIATRWSLKAIFALVQTSSTGYNDLDGRYFTIKGPNLRSLNTRSLCSTKKGP